MSELSTKPYLIRAIYEWCNDANFTPYVSIKVDQNVRVPMEYVKNGEIVLSVANQATRDLTIGNDRIQFSARFNGVSREISVPIYAVQAIFARENGRGYFFDPESPPDTNAAGLPHAPTLQSVPTKAPALQTVRLAGAAVAHDDHTSSNTVIDAVETETLTDAEPVARPPDHPESDTDKPKGPP
ncbi:MAG: ClpXP protease specificity-enhancing factor, partial [Pseudomonadota bacterium]